MAIALLAVFALLAYTAAGLQTYITSGNRVIVAGSTATFVCRSSYIPPYWYFHSITVGSRPCGFTSPYPGYTLCPSVSSSRASVTSYHNRTTLTIRRTTMSDAGTYTCGSHKPNSLYWASSIIVGVVGSSPTITLQSPTDGCILYEQNVSFTCKVMYSGTNLMPMKMRWKECIWYHRDHCFDYDNYDVLSTVNTSSVHQSSFPFMATKQTAGFAGIECAIGFSSPTGIVVRGVERQYSNQPNTWSLSLSSLYSPRIVANCSSEVEFTVNNTTAVHSGARLTVGDVVTCAAEGALMYRWTNMHHHAGDAITHGRTVRISQPGIFNYECTVLMECDNTVYCPFSRTITGFARDLVTTQSTTPVSTGYMHARERVSSATIALAVLLVILIIGIVAAAAAVLIYRHRRPPSHETNRNEPNPTTSDDTENQYVNSVALAAATDEQQACGRSDTDKCHNSCTAVYQDLDINETSSEQVLYETIKPRVMPKPSKGDSKT